MADITTSEEVKEEIRSPLRYPGGKTRALKKIERYIPEFTHYREAMVGGGSVFFYLKNKYPEKDYWINDKNTDLFFFWKFCKEEPENLISEIMTFSSTYKGKELFDYLKKTKIGLTNIQRGARFFILNRISFSGLVESGGYSDKSYTDRFTESSIERIRKASELLQGVKITNWDYSKVIEEGGENVFIFLDPPYISKAEAKLYGEKGKYHVDFSHTDFYIKIKDTKHKCLITYDKCQDIKDIYKVAHQIGWNIKAWRLKYGTNVNRKKTRRGDELFIWNYPLPEQEKTKEEIPLKTSKPKEVG